MQCQKDATESLSAAKVIPLSHTCMSCCMVCPVPVKRPVRMPLPLQGLKATDPDAASKVINGDTSSMNLTELQRSPPKIIEAPAGADAASDTMRRHRYLLLHSEAQTRPGRCMMEVVQCQHVLVHCLALSTNCCIDICRHKERRRRPAGSPAAAHLAVFLLGDFHGCFQGKQGLLYPLHSHLH